MALSAFGLQSDSATTFDDEAKELVVDTEDGKVGVEGAVWQQLEAQGISTTRLAIALQDYEDHLYDQVEVWGGQAASKRLLVYSNGSSLIWMQLTQQALGSDVAWKVDKVDSQGFAAVSAWPSDAGDRQRAWGSVARQVAFSTPDYGDGTQPRLNYLWNVLPVYGQYVRGDIQNDADKPYAVPAATGNAAVPNNTHLLAAEAPVFDTSTYTQHTYSVNGKKVVDNESLNELEWHYKKHVYMQGEFPEPRYGFDDTIGAWLNPDKLEPYQALAQDDLRDGTDSTNTAEGRRTFIKAPNGNVDGSVYVGWPGTRELVLMSTVNNRIVSFYRPRNFENEWKVGVRGGS